MKGGREGREGNKQKKKLLKADWAGVEWMWTTTGGGLGFKKKTCFICGWVQKGDFFLWVVVFWTFFLLFLFVLKMANYVF